MRHCGELLRIEQLRIANPIAAPLKRATRRFAQYDYFVGHPRSLARAEGGAPRASAECSTKTRLLQPIGGIFGNFGKAAFM